MSKGSIAQTVLELVAPLVAEEGLELVDVEYRKTGREWTLRILIDRTPGGVTVDDCQSISRKVEDLIEVENLVPSQYVLEVSSPGLDRPLKNERDFLRFMNKRITVKTYSSIENRKVFEGRITGFQNQTLYLDDAGTEREIPLKDIAQARLIIEF